MINANDFCIMNRFVCLFVVFRPIGEIFTRMETSPLPVKGCKINLCSALKAIEQWGTFSVPHLLWHGASAYNGHLQGPTFAFHPTAFDFLNLDYLYQKVSGTCSPEPKAQVSIC